MDFWTQQQNNKFIGIEKAFEEFCGADSKLSDLDSIYPGTKSEKFKDWYNQYVPAHDAAVERFVKLFREKVLVAWVLRDDKENDDGVTLPPEYWAQSVASLTLTKSRVEADLLDEQHLHLAKSRVVLRKRDRGKWTNGATPDSQQGPKEAVEIAVPEEPGEEKKLQARRRGRRPKYDWALFHEEIARIVGKDPDGFPVVQADLENTMTDWCVTTWGENNCPAESTIRDQVKKYYNDDSQGR